MSNFQLAFDERIIYPHNKQGINLDIFLSSQNNLQVSILAKLDTGSTYCIFQPRFAEMLQLKIEKGDPEIIRTATGKFIAYGHEITIKIENIEWNATIYFAEDESFPVNVLGRIGFLDRLKIGLVDYEQILFLNTYDT